MKKTNILFLLIINLLVGCANHDLTKKESWSVTLAPMGEGTYLFSGHFLELHSQASGQEQSRLELDLPSLLFHHKDGGASAEIGGEDYSLSSEVTVQGEGGQQSINYFLRYTQGSYTRSTRGTLSLQE